MVARHWLIVATWVLLGAADAAEQIRADIALLRVGPEATLEDDRRREELVAAITQLPDPVAQRELLVALEAQLVSEIETALSFLESDTEDMESHEAGAHRDRIVQAIQELRDSEIRDRLLNELKNKEL